jgi:hypothetical protein
LTCPFWHFFLFKGDIELSSLRNTPKHDTTKIVEKLILQKSVCWLFCKRFSTGHGLFAKICHALSSKRATKKPWPFFSRPLIRGGFTCLAGVLKQAVASGSIPGTVAVVAHSVNAFAEGSRGVRAKPVNSRATAIFGVGVSLELEDKPRKSSAVGSPGPEDGWLGWERLRHRAPCPVPMPAKARGFGVQKSVNSRVTIRHFADWSWRQRLPGWWSDKRRR